MGVFQYGLYVKILGETMFPNANKVRHVGQGRSARLSPPLLVRTNRLLVDPDAHALPAIRTARCALTVDSTQ